MFNSVNTFTESTVEYCESRRDRDVRERTQDRIRSRRARTGLLQGRRTSNVKSNRKEPVLEDFRKGLTLI